MKFFFFFIVILFFAYCRESTPTKEIDDYFEKEIQNRIEILDKAELEKDCLQINARTIDKKIKDLILLSKDVENLSASVNKANVYFEELAGKFKLNNSDFTKLTTGMHVNEIASILKENELNLLNQLVFKKNPSQLIPSTAQ